MKIVHNLKRLAIIVAMLLVSCSIERSGPNINLDKLPNDQMEFQKLIIGQLTGEMAIKTIDKSPFFIKSRWTKNEKKQALNYLKTVIAALDLTPQLHSYAIPNQNFGIDLLVEPLKGNNLYTVLPATTATDQYLVLGAHYDTGGKNVPGAIDNGSGIALALSVLKRIKNQDRRSKNVLIVFFDQEEEGISAGSVAFASYLSAHKFNIHSVHTFDLIGWDGDNNKEVELALPSPEIERLYKKHAAKLNIPIYVSKVTSTDHYSFIKEGFNAFCMSQAFAKGDISGKKDTPKDTYALVNFEYLDIAANLAYEAIKELLHD